MNTSTVLTEAVKHSHWQTSYSPESKDATPTADHGAVKTGIRVKTILRKKDPHTRLFDIAKKNISHTPKSKAEVHVYSCNILIL